jgi:adenine specific DNA methylase Mod
MTSPQNSYSIGQKEKRFNGALKDLFVGAKVDGESGYINLMRIKAAYYEKLVAPQLFEDVGTALKEFPGFREELFDKLHAFFTRYFSKSGSICFAYTPNHMSVYEKVYTDEQDVVLFWKTHMLYYVKSDRLFRDLKVEEDGQKFFFDCTHLQHKKNNEKRALVFSFDKVEKDGTVRLDVTYSERGRVTKTDDILKALKKAKAPLKEATLLRALKVFERQSEIDYFINKDARSFLREQFDLWMYQYLFKDGTAWNHGRIRQLQALKDIAFKLIDFIAQFEDELVRIWNKPKFVRGSHYVITLDRVAAQEGGFSLLADFLKHKGMAAQVEEWQGLGIVDKKFDPRDIFNEENRKAVEDANEENRKTGKEKEALPAFLPSSLNSGWRFLPLDTIHFKDLELPLLALFDDLDNQLDGRLIKSENYQALNTLGEKFKGRVDVTYIDPPYNTDASEIIYANAYKHSSWLSFMADRLTANDRYLKKSGILCVTIDDFELHRLRSCIEQLLPKSEFLGVASIRNNPAGRSSVKGFSISHEYGVFIAKSEEGKIGRVERTPEQIARYKEEDETGFYEWVNFRKHGGANAARSARPKLYYPFYVTSDSFRIPSMTWNEREKSWMVNEKPGSNETVVYPDTIDGAEKTWKWGHQTVLKTEADICLRRDRDDRLGLYMKSRLKDDGRLPSTLWLDKKYSASDYGTNLLKKLFGEEQLFDFPKSYLATADCIRVAATGKDSCTLDFFGGSGTTAHAVIHLNKSDGGNRKFIICEMGAHFDKVLLPRVKKVTYSDNWNNGIADQGQGASLFCKVCSLEQYEDAVAGSVYYENDAQADLFRNTKTNPYSQYVFFRDPKMARALEMDYEKNAVHPHLDRLYPDIDLAETLSCVTGKWIQRVTADEVVFTDGSKQSLKQPDWRLLKPLIFWGPIV